MDSLQEEPSPETQGKRPRLEPGLEHPHKAGDLKPWDLLFIASYMHMIIQMEIQMMIY